MRDFAFIALLGQLYVFGGYNGNRPLDTSYTFNAQVWRAREHMPVDSGIRIFDLYPDYYSTVK
jgi:hypothetical protein